MRLVRSQPFHWFPKWSRPLLCGADGWDGGYGILWLWWLLIIKEPDNNTLPT